MAWPMSQDYNEAIQNAAHCFADPDLQRGEVVTSELGLPIPCSGNFADVYAVAAGAHKWAIKCFTREIPGLKERYAAVSQYLQQVQLPFMVDFRFLEQGLRVRGQWYPILKMQWVEGLALNAFVRENLDKPQVLDALCQIWHRLAVRMQEANVAHCDLQHGNVLMVQGAVAGRIGVRLVDYDGMCVPALELLKSIEAGHPSYQHPQRLRERLYGMDVDRFSNLVIYTALRALRVGGKAVWEKYDNGDNLLFRPTDFAAPQASPLFQELLKLNDPEVAKLTRALALASQNSMDRVPLLEHLIGIPKPAVESVVRASPSFQGQKKPATDGSPAAEPVPRTSPSSQGQKKPATDGPPMAIPVARTSPSSQGQKKAATNGSPTTAWLASRNNRVAIAGLGFGFFGIAVAVLVIFVSGGNKEKNKTQTKGKKEATWSSPMVKSVESKAASNTEKTDVPPRPSRPALIFQCGKGNNGSDQVDLRSPGYDCKLTQGGNFQGWSGDALKTHCWAHDKEVRFEVIVPSGKEGILRLWLVDGDNRGRKERVSVQGRMIGEYADFGRKGVEVAVPVSATDAKSGKIDVSVVNLGPATAVVSTVAFTPQAIQPRR